MRVAGARLRILPLKLQNGVVGRGRGGIQKVTPMGAVFTRASRGELLPYEYRETLSKYWETFLGF